MASLGQAMLPRPRWTGNMLQRTAGILPIPNRSIMGPYGAPFTPGNSDDHLRFPRRPDPY